MLVDKNIINGNNIYFLLIVLFIITFTLKIIIPIGKEKYRIYLLITKLDPVKFLEQTDKEIDKKINSIQHNGNNKVLLQNTLKYIEILKLQKSDGLIAQGHYNEAQSLRNEIDMTKFDTTYIKIMELININTMYSLGKNEEASKIFLENEQQITEFSKNNGYKNVMIPIIARYNFYIGNFEESKRLFKEIIQTKPCKLTYVETEYYLALIDIKQGRVDEGKKRLTALLEPTKKIYLHDMIKRGLEV